MQNATICDCCRREIAGGNFPVIDKETKLAHISVKLVFTAMIEDKPADICRSCAEMISTGVIRRHLDPKTR